MSFKVPEGWTTIAMGTDLFVLKRPGEGCVTVCFRARYYALGQVTYVRPNRKQLDPQALQGRGWQQCLVNKAVAVLEEIYKDEK